MSDDFWLGFCGGCTVTMFLALIIIVIVEHATRKRIPIPDNAPPPYIAKHLKELAYDRGD